MNSFLVRLYTFSFLDELMLIYPFYAVMFVDYGMSGLEVSILFAAWSGTCVALEVPSGALADRFSRKWVMAAGQLIRMCGYACWALYPDFWGFFVGFVLWGTKSALSSGSFEALVYDELKRLEREGDYVKVLGRSRGLGNSGVIVSSLAATAVFGYGYEFLLWGSVAAVLLAFVLLLTLPEAPAVEATSERTYLKLLKNGVRYVVHQPAVLRLIVFVSVTVTVGGVLDEVLAAIRHRGRVAQIFAGRIRGCSVRGAGRVELRRASIRELAFQALLRFHPFVWSLAAARCLADEPSQRRLADSD